MATESAQPTDNSATRGFLFALSAYLLWGFLPFYMKAVAHIPAPEVVAHRIVWSVPIAGAVLLLLGRTADVKAAFRQPRTLLMAALTACLITVNWGIYVWAIAADRAVETALGYYINPLVIVAMGAVLLGEKLSRLQVAAVGLATLAVLVLTFDGGGMPWVSLALAISFAIYAFLRKTLPVGPSQGFFLEVLILSVPSLAYIFWLQARGEGHFLPSEPADIALLLGCGPVTAAPLMLYAFGAKLLRFSTIGIMQYIAPTMIFVIAIFFFHEPFSTVRAIAFGLIWTALALYSWSMFSNRTSASRS
ncbi:MAG: EamA family transporter RarD [Alphaproteobacteria bacterium]|nr:EamA family transporter RarD [Alphaproteobacteria bacterium]MBU0805759.1 EamA family transporter RarD [Alphaproteobacteria bacterium]MBU0872496.1 EamA family transporter RarD [Alphaproteobacteria bacterium]MBU1402991.1 EamA family transporter RarD [Alphaproteobacteria bacterium]MBU1593752.1 EamA family transporter RarD [Alphaproteobacteria bacterium]